MSRRTSSRCARRSRFGKWSTIPNERRARMSRKDVQRRAKELGIAFVRLQFADIHGVSKSVAIPVRELEDALDGHVVFDGSCIEGFVRHEESDMCLAPDPATFALLPSPPGT